MRNPKKRGKALKASAFHASIRIPNARSQDPTLSHTQASEVRAGRNRPSRLGWGKITTQRECNDCEIRSHRALRAGLNPQTAGHIAGLQMTGFSQPEYPSFIIHFATRKLKKQITRLFWKHPHLALIFIFRGSILSRQQLFGFIDLWGRGEKKLEVGMGGSSPGYEEQFWGGGMA